MLDTLNHASELGGEAVKQVLYNIEWTPEAIQSLQSSVNNSEVSTICLGINDFVSYQEICARLRIMYTVHSAL